MKKYLNDLKTLSREDATNKVFIGLSLLLLSFSIIIIIDTGTETDFRAESIRTIDGDTVEAFYNNSSVTVRFLGVDTPETHVENDPEEFGLEDTEENRECLRYWSERSTEFVENFTGPGTEIYTDEESERYGYYGRLLAYVEKNNKILNEVLLEKGYARVYVSEFTQLEKYLEIEENAKNKNIGVWSC